METFLYRAMNQTLLKKDVSKYETLGPYSIIIGKILQNWAAESRQDIKPFGFSNQAKLFRGA